MALFELFFLPFTSSLVPLSLHFLLSSVFSFLLSTACLQISPTCFWEGKKKLLIYPWGFFLLFFFKLSREGATF